MDNETKTVQRLVRFVTFTLIFILFTRTPADADLWWHLRAGQVMFEQKQILLTDVFSFTRFGENWVNAFWVSELLLFGLYSLGRYFAITLFVSFTGAVTFYLLSHRLNGNDFINAFAIILAAVAAAPIWGPRPQIISFLFIALLDDWLTRKRPAWLLPALFALWANLHGGWIWGFLLILAHLAGNILTLATQPEERKKLWHETRNLALWSLIVALAIGLNPNGLGIWTLPFKQVSVSMQIQEWLSPNFHRIDFHPFLWMLFLLLLVSPFAPKPPAWGQIIKVLGFSYLTFVAQRNIAIAAIVAAPLLADWMNAALKNLQTDKRLSPRPNLPLPLRTFINTLLIFSLSAAALGNAYAASTPDKVEKNYPTAAIAWMKTNRPQGPMFNSYNLGGYLLWTLPEYPVFIDGRADLYGDELIHEWMEISNGTDSGLALLEERGIQIILLEPEHGLIPRLNPQEWRQVYADDKIIIYQKNKSASL